MTTGSPGLLISFDGTDSSGKATQTRLLKERLAANHTAEQFETPDYTTETGKKLKALFQESNGSWNDLDWQEQMKLLAANRAEHRQEVAAILEQGGVVIYDRYVPSSQAHMTVSALAKDEIASGREKIIAAVGQHEYEQNRMPHEDLSIFLDVPPPLAAQLLTNRQHKHQDQAEATDEISLQQRIYDEYQWMTQTQPQKYVRIECLDSGKLLPPKVIAERVWQELSKKFPHITKVA